MDINLTLIGQSIAMLVFVWFCMKVIWPPLLNALEERQKQIEDGLAAADRGQEKLVQCRRLYRRADTAPDRTANQGRWPDSSSVHDRVQLHT